jgi:hypothetical protein
MKKLFFIFFLVSLCNQLDAEINPCNTCNTEYCMQPRWVPYTVYDYTTVFNEKRYWLEINQITGEVQICYQRIDIYPEFFMTPNIHCYRATPTEVPPQLGAVGNYRCWRSGKTTICRNDDTGELLLDNEGN